MRDDPGTVSATEKRTATILLIKESWLSLNYAGVLAYSNSCMIQL